MKDSVKQFLISGLKLVITTIVLGWLIWLATQYAPSSSTDSKEWEIPIAVIWIGAIGIGSGVIALAIGIGHGLWKKKALRLAELAKAGTPNPPPTTPPVAPAPAATKTDANKAEVKRGWLASSSLFLGRAFLWFIGLSVSMVIVGGITAVIATGGNLAPTPQPQWQFSWKKPPGFAGPNPEIRSQTLNAQLLRNDQYGLAFLVTFSHQGERREAYYEWDRSQTRGTWKQKESGDHGDWWMEKDPTNPNRWTGTLTDQASKAVGKEYLIELQLVAVGRP